MASKAAAPPPTLSELICETANDGSFTVVSTRTTLMPALAACSSGACMAVTSVGAMSIAAGLDAVDRVDDRLLQGGVELLRALRGDGVAELGGLGLDAALHGDVELVAGDALDERDVLVGVRPAAAAGAVDVSSEFPLLQAASARTAVALSAASLMVFLMVVLPSFGGGGVCSCRWWVGDRRGDRLLSGAAGAWF